MDLIGWNGQTVKVGVAAEFPHCWNQLAELLYNYSCNFGAGACWCQVPFAIANSPVSQELRITARLFATQP